MSLGHLALKSSTVKLEIHLSMLPRPLLPQPPTSLAGCQLDWWITGCSETRRWASQLTNLGLECCETAAGALLCIISSIFHSARLLNSCLFYLLGTAQWPYLTAHRHLDHLQGNKPSSLCCLSPLFIHSISKHDFIGVSITAHILWALVNISAEKELYFTSFVAVHNLLQMFPQRRPFCCGPSTTI